MQPRMERKQKGDAALLGEGYFFDGSSLGELSSMLLRDVLCL